LAKSRTGGKTAAYWQSLDLAFYFDYCGNTDIDPAMKKSDVQQTARFAKMLAAMGTEPRLRIVRLLLSAHPQGMVVGEIAQELGIANSTLSHHLEKLRHEGLVTVQREGTYLRCLADTQGLQDLLSFLYAECCTRSKAVAPDKIVCCS
jgi:ArsR family transcriptional regulator, arsenate/arsenite/antimonite-responsive transcriptional repressor